jgi:hypothetical protein
MIGGNRVPMMLPSVSVPRSFFGIHAQDIQSISDPRTALFPEMGHGTFRILEPFYSAWSNIEPVSAAASDFSYITAMVDGLIAVGIKPIWCFRGTPAWARVGDETTPATTAAYHGWLARSAAAMSGKAIIYHLWNEMDSATFYKGTTSDAIDALTGAATIIKGVDPTATVWAPSVTANGNAWLNTVLASGALDDCDAVTFHGYAYPAAPEGMIPVISKFRSLAEYHDFSGLYMTEWGWTSFIASGQTETYPTLMSDAQAAAYMVRGFLIAAMYGVQGAHFFSIDGDKTGNAEFSCVKFVDDETQQVLQDPGTAVQYLISVIGGGTLYSMSHRGNLWRVYWTNGASSGAIYWSDDTTTTNVDLSAVASLKSVLGAALSPSVSYSVTSSPVYAFN